MEEEQGRGVGPDPEEGAMPEGHHPRVSRKDIPRPCKGPPEKDQDEGVEIEVIPDQEGKNAERKHGNPWDGLQ